MVLIGTIQYLSSNQSLNGLKSTNDLYRWLNQAMFLNLDRPLQIKLMDVVDFIPHLLQKKIKKCWLSWAHFDDLVMETWDFDCKFIKDWFVFNHFGLILMKINLTSQRTKVQKGLMGLRRYLADAHVWWLHQFKNVSWVETSLQWDRIEMPPHQSPWRVSFTPPPSIMAKHQLASVNPWWGRLDWVSHYT